MGTPAFSVRGYEVTTTGKKPNVFHVPELLAIVATAARLGKKVEVTVSGVGDAAQVDFRFVDTAPSVPNDLVY